MEFDFYYGTQADQFSFIKIPKVMLTEESFSSLSLAAKILYGLLLDRMSLSMKNEWLDKENKVYIIYQISEIQEDLGFSKKKAIDCLGELEKFGLVEKKKRGFGLPSIIYVKNFIVGANEAYKSDENGTSRGVDFGTSGEGDNHNEIVKNSENIVEFSEKDADKGGICTRGVDIGTTRGVDLGTSRGVNLGTSRGVNLGTSEVPDWEPLNSNTKYNNTNISHTNLILSADESENRYDEMDDYETYKEIVKENVEYDALIERHPYEKERIDEILELLLETLISKNSSIVIASDSYPIELVKSKLLKLDISHIEYVIECLANNTTKIKNYKKYVLATLFNAPNTISGFYRAEVNHDMPQFARKMC